MKKMKKTISKIKTILDENDIDYDEFMIQFNESIKCKGFRSPCKNNQF